MRRLSRERIPWDQIEDVVQATWLRYCQRRPAFTGDDVDFQRQRWLAKAAHDEAANVFRYLDKHPTESLNDLPKEPADRQDEVVDQLEKACWSELVRVWMAELEGKNPLNYRLMLGAYQEGLTVAELADKEGLKRRDVTVRLSRVRALWRKRAARLRAKDADA